MAKKIKIISSVEGFRRGGIAHSQEAKVYNLADFTKEQLAQIKGEKRLVCTIFEEKEDKSKKPVKAEVETAKEATKAEE